MTTRQEKVTPHLPSSQSLIWLPPVPPVLRQRATPAHKRGAHSPKHTGTLRGAPHGRGPTLGTRNACVAGRHACPPGRPRRALRLTCLKHHLVIVLGPEGIQHGHEEHPAGVLDAEHRPVAPHGRQHHQPAPAALGRLRGLGARRPRQLHLYVLGGRLRTVWGSRAGQRGSPHGRGAERLRLARPRLGDGLRGGGHHGPSGPRWAPREREGREFPAGSPRSCPSPEPGARSPEGDLARPKREQWSRSWGAPPGAGAAWRKAAAWRSLRVRDSKSQSTAPHPHAAQSPALKDAPHPAGWGRGRQRDGPQVSTRVGLGERRRGPAPSPSPARSADPGAGSQKCRSPGLSVNGRGASSRCRPEGPQGSRVGSLVSAHWQPHNHCLFVLFCCFGFQL